MLATIKKIMNNFGILPTSPQRVATQEREFAKRDMKHGDVPLSSGISHQNFQKFLFDTFDKPGFEILEVGARNVVFDGFKSLFKHANHTGFDYYAGKNVDVVGDAHQLSSFFPMKRFDLIFSSAVFEHLAMPWKVALEMAKILKIGGHIFVETHYSYSSHERPWHFFQFSEEALKVLFPPAMGLQCIEAGCSNPINGVFAHDACAGLAGRPVTGLYCHSEILVKKIHETNFSWENVTVEDLVGDARYPTPTK